MYKQSKNKQKKDQSNVLQSTMTFKIEMMLTRTEKNITESMTKTEKEIARRWPEHNRRFRRFRSNAYRRTDGRTYGHMDEQTLLKRC